MRKQNEEPLAEVIKRMMKAYGLDDGIRATIINHEWNQLMGPAVARQTREITLKKGRLTIALHSAALREELSYGKELIKKRLNEILGEQVIEEVVVH